MVLMPSEPHCRALMVFMSSEPHFRALMVLTEGKRTKCAEFGYLVTKFISSAARGSRDRYVGIEAKQ